MRLRGQRRVCQSLGVLARLAGAVVVGGVLDGGVRAQGAPMCAVPNKNSVLGVGLALTSPTPPTPPATHIAYTVTVANPAQHLFHVTATANGIPTTRTSLDWAIPAWSPGWYVLTHAYQNLHDVSATDASGNPLTLTHTDSLTWHVALPPATGQGDSAARSVTISYDVSAIDRDPDALDIGLSTTKNYGFFSPYLDTTNGFAPGPAMLMYLPDGKSAPCSVTYRVPAGWQIADANDPTANPATFTAPNYDTLADQPADLGRFLRTDRTVGGVPVSVVIVGVRATANTSRWVERTFRIARSGIALWGAKTPPPFPRYLFQFRFPVNEAGGGGLEHLNGTVITLDRTDMTPASADDMELVAHEFLHAWNVKRIRPEKLGPFDYTQPVRIRDLWWSEGVTDYFAPRIVVGAGIADTTWWRDYFSHQIDDLQHNPARRNVTLETASFKAWEGKSEGYGGLSYYNKGAVAGLLLDIEMRRRTNNRVGVIDVLKALLAESVKTGRGFPEGEIERLASKLTGSDFGPFFTLLLRSTDELPYEPTLTAAGLTVTDTVTETADLGFVPVDDGAVVQPHEIAAKGPAAAAGLLSSDRIVGIASSGGTASVESIGWSSGPLSDRLIASRPGQRLRLLVLRRGNRRTITLRVGRSEEHKYRLELLPHPTAAQTAILRAIDGSEALMQ